MQQIIYLVHAYHVSCNTMVILLWSVWSFGAFGWYGVHINVCYYPRQIERSLSGNAGWISNAYIRSYSWASQCHVHQPCVTGWICFVISVVMLTFLTNISIWLLIRENLIRSLQKSSLTYAFYFSAFSVFAPGLIEWMKL